MYYYYIVNGRFFAEGCNFVICAPWKIPIDFVGRLCH